MESLPAFFRAETYHPLTVHFPIVLLLLATVLQLLQPWIKAQKLWLKLSAGILWAGTAAAWLAIYTGDQADGLVSRTLCDPTVLKAHENAAYVTGYLSLAGSLLLGLRLWNRWPALHRWAYALTVALLLTGSGYLTYVGHQGAKLVYQQAAGVYVPAEDCKEWE
jgi:uncharacterized membrane protein